jgi:cell surface protein SprA
MFFSRFYKDHRSDKSQLRQLNEQSMVLRIQDLEDGDARAAFRNVNLDVRQYRRLRMEVHAEALIGQSLSDDELTAFIRIGSDTRATFKNMKFR